MHSWPTTTRHLRVLESGLVSVRRTGRSSIYRLERERLRAVVRAGSPPSPYSDSQGTFVNRR